MSLADPSTWHPKESADDLWNERSFLAGILIGAVAYGVHATLFFTTLSILWKRKRSEWRDYNWIAFVLVLFTISSIANYGQLKFTQMIWIDNRDYPRGPSAYLVEQQTAFEARLVVGGYMVNGWLQDGLILYRFWIIFSGRRYIVALPTALFFGTIAVSTWLMTIISRQSYFEGTGAALLIAYYTLSVALNLFATVTISVKLWAARRRLRDVSTSISSSYLSVSAILIESAFLYTACGIAFLVPFGLGDPFQNVILPTLAQVESIAPLLIIMRVAQGHAWSPSVEDTQFATTSIALSTHRQHGSTQADREYEPHELLSLSMGRNEGSRNSTVKVDRRSTASAYDVEGGDQVFNLSTKH
ncbi:hypothetical protein EXIGLDRAFT_842663 [Exidia glandulosa HHB12029]|uniref:Family A G protein-coupled receptor-like protein n=1 Tax=Exidia glandulosa HHB12029 TaxID=1314781 RepID=A0A165D521_EXIGL|nr:hypothetical protein EXIGLDRAFT_842663 [Exidia glandulosa HHB12029]